MLRGNQRDRRSRWLTIAHSALGLALPDTPEIKRKETRRQEEKESRKGEWRGERNGGG